MGFNETIAGEDFLGLDEPQQIARLSAENDSFRAAYASAPEKATEFMRSRLGRGGRPTQFEDIIARAAVKHRIDPRMLKAQIQAESNFDPDAVGAAGEQGLMQIMPKTQVELGITDPHDPEQSIMAGAGYLRKQYDRFGNWEHALAAYNAGASRVAEYEGIPPFKVTQNYVKKIMADYEGQRPPARAQQASPSRKASAPPNLPPPAAEEAPAGSTAADRALRQVGFGFAESFTDSAQGLAYAANWALSMMGLPETSVAESIGGWEDENLPEPVTPEGRVGREVGYGAGFGLQSAVGGAGLVKSGIPGISKVAKFITARPGTEIAAGAVGGGAAALVGEKTDNPFARLGAGLLGGVTAGGAVEAGTRRYTKAALVGEVAEQESKIIAAKQTHLQGLRRKAFDRLTANEQKLLSREGQKPFVPKAVQDKAIEAEGMRVMRDLDMNYAKTLDSETTGKLVQAYKDFLKTAPASWKPEGISVTSHVREAVHSKVLDLDNIKPILDNNGITLEDFVMGFQATTSNAGRILGQLSQARRAEKKMLTHLKDTGQATDADFRRLDELAGVDIEPMGFWRRLENVRRGMLVTQMSTAMRNAETQIANLTVNTIGQLMEAAMHQVFRGAARVVGREWNPARSADALGPLARIFVSPFKTKRQVNQLMGEKAFQGEMSRLFFRGASEAEGVETIAKTGVMSGMESVTKILNTANRFQEWGIRRAVFASELDRSLASSGKSLADMEAAGTLGDIDPMHIKQAVDRALEMTWGREFSRNAMGFEGMAGSFIHLTNTVGIGPLRLTQIVPFPRFMMNSLKWQYEHSPLALNKLLYSKDEWAKVAAGDLSTITKAATGTAMLMSAHQIRTGEHAGEKWYQVRPGQEQAEWLRDNIGIDMIDSETGEIGTFDTRPFNPFATYLFVADLADRIRKGTVHSMGTKDLAMGFMAVNLRAGAGLYILDKAIDDWTQALQVDEDLAPGERSEAMANKFMQGALGYGGAAWAGMLVPFQQINDALASFDMYMGKEAPAVKDANADPLFGQFRTKLSAFGAAEGLPDVELATRSEPPRSIAPGARQLSGATIRGPKNVAEKELDRLDFDMGEILGSSGNDAYDRLMKKHMGPAFERYVVRAVNRGGYQRASDGQKAELLRGALKTARKVAKGKADREDRGLAREVKESRKPRRQRRAEGEKKRQRAADREAYLRRKGVL